MSSAAKSGSSLTGSVQAGKEKLFAGVIIGWEFESGARLLFAIVSRLQRAESTG